MEVARPGQLWLGLVGKEDNVGSVGTSGLAELLLGVTRPVVAVEAGQILYSQ